MQAQPTTNEGNVSLAISMLGIGLFGPQSKWSALLRQREHLQIEIQNGRRYLEQFRKDLAECAAPLMTLAQEQWQASASWTPMLVRQAASEDIIEQTLLSFLERLEERLQAVHKEIEQIQGDGHPEPLDPEEDMFALLRAAG
jgi:hypothetical protein